MTWASSAACRDLPKPMFFPQGDPRSPQYQKAVAAAKLVCAGCPVISECREAGKGLDGIWGGLDAHERGVRRSHRLPASCGTPAGYKRHWRRREDPCDECLRAVADDSARVRAAAAASSAANVRAMFGRAS